MKKILAIILSLATAVLTSVGLSACNREYDPIDYTAEKPFLEYSDFGYAYTEDRLIAEYDNFDEYEAFYKQNCLNSGLYLLNYGYDSNYNFGERTINYKLYNFADKNEIIAVEEFPIYDRDICTDKNQSITGMCITVELLIFIKPASNQSLSGFILEFGKNPYTYYSRYINIYLGDECFATCYYQEWVSMNKEWFENYFKENLLWGDSL